jgi:hypothetical protein
MNIHQVSVSYVQEQDRLLIRINGKEGGELRAWLTRRLALALLPVLSQTSTEQISKIAATVATSALPADSAADPRGQLLAAFQTEAALRSGDFETPYQTPAEAPDAAADGPEPMLLTELKVTLLGNGQLRLQLFEKLPGRETVRTVQVMMDPQLSNALLQLLHQSVNASQWLQLPVIAGLEPAVESTEPAELAADLAKPRYLN